MFSNSVLTLMKKHYHWQARWKKTIMSLCYKQTFWLVHLSVNELLHQNNGQAAMNLRRFPGGFKLACAYWFDGMIVKKTMGKKRTLPDKEVRSAAQICFSQHARSASHSGTVTHRVLRTDTKFAVSRRQTATTKHTEARRKKAGQQGQTLRVLSVVHL